MRLAPLLLSLAAALAAAAAPPSSKDSERQTTDDVIVLRGQWELASTADANRVTPGNRLLRMVVTQAGRVRFLLDGAETNAGAFLPAKGGGKPRAIDLKLSDGKVFRGVYALDGTALILCFAEDGGPRPVALKPSGAQWAERWERPARRREVPGPASCRKPVGVREER